MRKVESHSFIQLLFQLGFALCPGPNWISFTGVAFGGLQKIKDLIPILERVQKGGANSFTQRTKETKTKGL